MESRGERRGETILLLKKLELKSVPMCKETSLYKHCKDIKGIVLAKMCKNNSC